MIDQFQDGRSEAYLSQMSVGIRLSDVTQERLIDVIEIYDHAVGASTLPDSSELRSRLAFDHLAELHSGIDKGGLEFYLGSIINREGKLLVGTAESVDDGESIINFAFDANFTNPSDKQRRQSERLTREFNRSVNEYLMANNVGILLPTEAPAPIVTEVESSTIQLSDALLDTAYLNNRIYKGPDGIDLGEFNEWVEALVAWTNNHPERHEAGGLILTEFLLGVVKPTGLIQGSKNFVEFCRREFIDYQKSRANIFYSAVGAIAHSHPSQNPFSPPDFVHLLLSNNEPTAATSLILVNQGFKYVAFRGEKTPSMTRDEAENETKQRLADFRVKVKSWPGADSSIYREGIAEIVEYPFVFYEMCKDWDLQIFRSKNDEQVLHRLTHEQMYEEAQDLRRQATR